MVDARDEPAGGGAVAVAVAVVAEHRLAGGGESRAHLGEVGQLAPLDQPVDGAAHGVEGVEVEDGRQVHDAVVRKGGDLVLGDGPAQTGDLGSVVHVVTPGSHPWIE